MTFYFNTEHHLKTNIYTNNLIVQLNTVPMIKDDCKNWSYVKELLKQGKATEQESSIRLEFKACLTLKQKVKKSAKDKPEKKEGTETDGREQIEERIVSFNDQYCHKLLALQNYLTILYFAHNTNANAFMIAGVDDAGKTVGLSRSEACRLLNQVSNRTQKTTLQLNPFVDEIKPDHFVVGIEVKRSINLASNPDGSYSTVSGSEAQPLRDDYVQNFMQDHINQDITGKITTSYNPNPELIYQFSCDMRRGLGGVLTTNIKDVVASFGTDLNITACRILFGDYTLSIRNFD